MNIFKKIIRLFRKKKASDLQEEKKTIVSIFTRTARELQELREDSDKFIAAKKARIAKEQREVETAEKEIESVDMIYGNIMRVISPTEGESIG